MQALSPLSGGQRIWRRIGILRPMLPFLMLGIGWLIPAMRVPVGMPQTNTLWVLIFASFLIVVVWLIAEMTMLADRNTTVGRLQADNIISFAVALGITYFLQGNWEWWIVIPWIGCVADGFLSGWLAINNAAQKPLMQSGTG